MGILKKLAKTTINLTKKGIHYALSKHCKKCGTEIPPNTKYDWCPKCYQEYAEKHGWKKRNNK